MSKIDDTDNHTAGKPTSSSTLLVRVVFHAIRRHPVGFLGVILLGAVAGAGIWFFLPLPKNTAAVVFHISSQPQAILAPTAENRIDFASYKQSQVALIKSRRTLNAAFKQPEVSNLQIIRAAQPDELTWIDQRLTVDARGNAEYMRATVEGDSAEELLVLLSAVSRAYLAATYERDNGARISRQAELEKSYEKTRKEVEKFHDRIDEIAKVLGSKEGATLAIFESFRQDSLRAAVRDHASLQDDLASAKSRLQASLDTAKTMSNRANALSVVGLFGTPTSRMAQIVWLAPFPRQGEVPPAIIDDELRRDPGMREREQAVLKARQLLQDVEDRFQEGANTPALAKAREELKASEEKREKYRSEARVELSFQLRQRAAQIEEQRITVMQSEVNELNTRVVRAAAKVISIQNDISRSNEYKVDLENLRSDIAQKEKMTAVMADEIERMKIELKAPARVTMSEDPFIIPGIEGNRRLKYSTLSGVGMFLAGFCALVYWEYRGRRVTHPDEVSTGLGTRLIGTIPPLSTSTREDLSKNASLVLVEAIDTTRTMLLHAAPEGCKLRVLAVTSAVSGEGKTTLSGHLAISLARAGYRTLLIDGDLHAPSAQLLFGIPNTPGLSELLRGEEKLAGVVHATPIQRLSIIPAGKWSQVTRQMLAGDRWHRLKHELESQYDFVVIDTSPLLLVSDTLLLAREVDGVILSVLLGTSQIARVAETISRLRAVGATLAGVVVHNVHNEVYSRNYGYGQTAINRSEALTDSDDLPLAEALSSLDDRTTER